MLKLFANLFWIYTPGIFQKQISKAFSCVFEMKFSRFFILPYCLFFGLTTDYIDQFEPESSDKTYYSYSDFFKRKYKNAATKSTWSLQRRDGCDDFFVDRSGVFMVARAFVIQPENF